MWGILLKLMGTCCVVILGRDEWQRGSSQIMLKFHQALGSPNVSPSASDSATG